MQTSNPTLNSKTFQNLEYSESAGVMTIQGTSMKTVLLLLMAALTAGVTWHLVGARSGMVMPVMIGGLIGGFIMAIVTAFKKEWAPVTAPMYALLEGLFLGAFSALINLQAPGVPFQALMLTFGTLFFMLTAYQSGMIKATEKFKMGVMAATMGIFFFYMLTWVLSFFGIQVPFLFGNGLLSIGFSLFVVVIAALNLVLDFDLIEQGANQGAPKYMEWYGAFALMVTLIWLYIELVRLLTKLQSRD